MKTTNRLSVARGQLGGSTRFGSTSVLAMTLAMVLGAGPVLGQDLGGGLGGLGGGLGGGGGGVSAGASVGGGGVSAGASVGGSGGISAGASVGGGSGVNATVGVGKTTTGTGTGTGTTGAVPKAPIARVVVLPGKKKPTSPAKTVNSVVDLDASVLGLDVSADVLSKEGTVLDVCIGSCLDTRRTTAPVDPTPGDPNDEDVTDNDGTPTDPAVLPPVTAVSTVTTTVNGVTTAVFAGSGGAGPCGDAGIGATNASMSGAESNGNPGPNFTMSTKDLNLPVRGAELRCSAGGNSQVFNGYQVIDSLGEPIGVVHDIFFTADLDIRRVQFQSLDQRCFGLSNGKYEIEGASLRVDIPASVLP